MDRKPKVFVGSSTEQLELAREIQIRLHEHGAEVTVWQDGVFDIAKTTWHNLEKALSAAHFGIFIMGPDDIVFTRKKNFKGSQRQCSFRIGIFCGKIGSSQNVHSATQGIKS